MANAERGTVGFEVDGKPYTLKFSTNAMCELEDQTGGKSVGEFLKSISAGALSTTTARLLFWVLLIEHQPAMTLRDAGVLLDAAGGLGAVIGPMEKAMVLAMPKDKAEGRGPVGGKPKKRKASG